MIFQLIFAVSCEKKQADVLNKPSTDREEKPVKGGTLVIGINGEPDALNPLVALTSYGRDVIGMVFSRLATINPDLVTFTPELARAWYFSDDSLSLTFVLRTDVFWHDGNRFTAEDVSFTYRMQTDPDIAWDGYSFKENISLVEVVDDSTVCYHFRELTPTLLMDATEGYIVPEHILTAIKPADIRQDDFNRHPVGTGPFKFSRWEEQQSIELVRWENYYKPDLPYLDRVIFKIVASDVNLVQQLKANEIDFMQNVPTGDFLRIREQYDQGNGNFTPITLLGRSYDYIGWNLVDSREFDAISSRTDDPKEIYRQVSAHPLFGSEIVRRALTMAIDQGQLIQSVTRGLAISIDGPIPPIMWAFNPAANHDWGFNVKKARELLEQEGWIDHDGDGIRDKDGMEFSFEMLTNAGNERRARALTILQNMFREIQIEMQPRILDPGLLLGQLIPQKEFDAILLGWDVGLKMDFTPLFHSSTLAIPFHFTGYQSDEFDYWHDLALKTTNKGEAGKAWDKVAGILSKDLPYTWLYYRMDTAVIHNRFRGMVFDNRGTLINIERWWIPVNERIFIDKVFQED